MNICYYCGSSNPDTLDHTIPVSYYSSEPVRKSRANVSAVRSKSPVPVVDACGECNRTISNKLIMDVRERASYLKEKYLKKYNRLLKSPNWDEEDLEDLGWSLRSTVENNIQLKENMQNRLSSLDMVIDLPYDPFVAEKEALG